MRSRKPTSREKKSVQKKVDWKALEIVHPDAAGIDVGGSEHWVAISPDRDPEPVRRFGCFTADLREMGRWLVARGVRSVAMQSTGVYWMPVFEVLEQYGLEVFLVNAQHTKNVPGRKTDLQECQWLLKLHAFGPAESQLPAHRRDPDCAQSMAAQGQSGGRCRQHNSTHTESIDRDEHPTQQCAERPQRCKWNEDHRSHFGRGA